MKRSAIVLVIVLVFVGVVVHLAVSWQDFATLAKNGYLYDDSFYAFQIARNIAEGQGPTFDGITYTNGFQPLYVLLLVPLFLLFGSNAILPVYAGLTMLALLTVATAFLLFLIARRYVSEYIALFVTALWVFSPVVVRQSCNGLETALALFFFAVSVYYYLDRIRSNPDPSRGAFIKLGLLLGLAALARVDEVFLALAMALDYLFLARKRRSAPAKVFGDVAAATISTFLIYLPWMIYGVAVVGSPFQESGVATRFLSIAYAPFFDMGSNDAAAGGPTFSFIWNHIVHSVSILKLSPPVHVFFRTFEKIGLATGTAEQLRMIMNVLGLAMLAGIVFATAHRAKSGRNGKRGELNFLLLFALLLICAYSLYVFGMFFFTRYFYPIYFIAAIIAACFISDLMVWIRCQGRICRQTAAVMSVLYVAGAMYMGYTAGFKSEPVYHFYDVAKWIEKNTNEDDTIGVFQGGVIGYLSHRRVVNLDGKVNKHALEALKNRTMREYIQEAGIDLVMDHEVVLNLFLDPQDKRPPGSSASADRFFKGAKIGALGWSGYRLSPVAGRNAGGAVPVHGGSSPLE